MNRKEAFIRIQHASRIGGFTLLDVIPEFSGFTPSSVQEYLQRAFDLGFITLNAQNPLCMYPTQKLMEIR